MEKVLKEIAEKMSNSKKILVLSGAGMSTESGIPDFRGKNGIYNTNPEHILSRDYFFRKPGRFYQFIKDQLYFPEAKPNRGHEILANWEKEGRDVQIITQNIDGFHSAAGNQNVIEFHGSFLTGTCHNPKCQKKHLIADVLAGIDKRRHYCDCDADYNRRIIKPDFVLYDEVGYWFTGNPWYTIRCMAYDADIIFILGSTMNIYPFRLIPTFRNNDKRTPIVIINKGKTTFDDEPNTILINDSISVVLEDINKNL